MASISMLSDRYRVVFTRESEKDLTRLRSHLDRVMRVVSRLEVEPHAGHTLAGLLRGTRALEFSLPGSGVYRAVYYIDTQTRSCLIVIIGPHENIYNKAERRVEALKRAGKL